MRKIICAILAILLMVSLSACVIIGPRDEKSLSTKAPSGSSEPQETDPQETKPLLEETVLYEDESYKITVTGMEETIWGTEIKLLLENNTDRNIALSGDVFVVNGITMDGSLYLDVAAGKKANGEITLHTSDLETAGITEIAAVTAYDANIFDTDNYKDLLSTPLEIKTSIADDYTQPINDDGDVLWEGEGITVISRVIQNSLFGRNVKLLIKNNSEDDIVVQADNVSVNGFTISEIMSSDVVAGTVCYTDMTVMEYSLEDNGIEDIEEVSFTLKILNPETFHTIAETGELTVYTSEE